MSLSDIMGNVGASPLVKHYTAKTLLDSLWTNYQNVFLHFLYPFQNLVPTLPILQLSH